MRSRFALLLAVVLWVAPAAAEELRYFGHHPVPLGQGGFCYLPGSHAHPFAPDAAVAHLFRVQRGHLYFVGDPYHLGYGGPAYAYDSHHPIHAAFGGGWCYLDGPHSHVFHPHRDDVRAYTTFGGRYYYIGALSPAYAAGREKLYFAEPPYATLPVYATIYANRHVLALQFGHPASVAYVAKGKLPKKAYVPGVYSAAYFGVSGVHAEMSVGVPGISAGVGVALPGVAAGVGVAVPGISAGVSFGVGVGVEPARAGVAVVGPERVPPGWRHGKKKGWHKKRRRR